MTSALFAADDLRGQRDVRVNGRICPYVLLPFAYLAVPLPDAPGRMTLIENWSERVRRGGTLPPPIDFLLRPATHAVQFGMGRRLRQPAERVTAYIVSFGNLTAGGTGKTPAVIARARQELGEGRRVAVLTRGYGAPDDAPAVSAELDPEAYYDHLGDEAALMLRKQPDLIVFKNPDRVAAAHRAIDEYGCSVLILDDGYQYTALERDENTLVLDATNPFGNRRLLPRGTLREPPEAMRRATGIILTRCDQAADVDAVLAEIDALAPGAPVRLTRHAPVGVLHLASGEFLPVDWVAGRAVTAACGIGRPEAFFATLESLGARLEGRIVVADHAAFGDSVLPSEGPVVTTEKDAVRVAHPVENLYALTIELETWPGGGRD